MTFKHRHRHWALTLLIAATFAAAFTVQGCGDKSAESPQASTPSTAADTRAQQAYEPVTVQHKLGTTVIEKMPQRVVALDMNEVDFLDQLGVPVVGMPKDFIPHFLDKYKDAPQVQDTGAIVQPNVERVHAARPDLILITSLHAQHYKELSEIAQARRITQDRTDKALIVLHNNGAFSSLGVQSRYGFVFNALGVHPAGPAVETGLHGQPVSSEFIQQANPDVIYIVDRTAVMERRPALSAETLGNPLLRQTNAWKNDRVIFADAEAWYITAASPSSVKLVIDDVIQGYRD